MIEEHEFKKYANITSVERLRAFVCDTCNDISDVLKRYKDNIKISQALYPELSILEITLRNSIDCVFKEYFGENWLIDEVKNNTILDEYDYRILLKAYNDVELECKVKSKTVSAGKIISNLNFGFWTNICLKKYNSKIWTKKGIFKNVFTNYPKDKQQQIHFISKKLNSIRRLRNRVFHYEIILKNPEELLNKYNEILEVLSFLPNDYIDILKDTTNFLEVYQNIVATESKNLKHYTEKL
jgi:hypothetical protein